MRINIARNSGFSIIEVMVVIVLIGILAVMGRATYLKYLARGKVTEAIKLLDEYQLSAAALRARYGTIDPYYVLFTDSDTAGLIYGAPGSGPAAKQLNLKYTSNVSAETGTDANGNNYILLGVGLVNDGTFVSGKDHVYVAGIETPDGAFSWQCGISVSKGDTIEDRYLPNSCLQTLP